MGPDEWREARVADLVADGSLAINDGYRVRNTELGSAGIPFVRGGDIGDGWILTEVADHIRPEFQDRVVGKLTKEGDIAFITKGTVGRVGYLRPGQPAVVFAPQVCYWRVLDAAILDQRFLYFLMNGPEFKANLDAVKTHGSMVADYVSLSDQRLFRLRLPRIETQRAIGCILGSLDDKIELNRRTNETLEAMARTLFRSWFVDFDPVRAKADGQKPQGMDATTAKLFPDSLEPSDLGPIPKGWRTGTLSEVISIHDSKRVPLSGRERELRPGQYPYYGAAAVMDYIDGYLFDGDYVLAGEDGSVVNDDGSPVLQYATGKFWVNNHAHVLTGQHSITQPHLHLMLQTVDVRPFVTGAVQPKLNQGNLCRIPVVVVPPPINDAFGKAVSQLYALIQANLQQSNTLAATRDALLPKLLSGEVRVEDTEPLIREVV